VKLIRINDTAKAVAWNYILEYRPKPPRQDIVQRIWQELLEHAKEGNRVPVRFNLEKAVGEVRWQIKRGLFGRPKKR
jgi:hypothetical protein